MKSKIIALIVCLLYIQLSYSQTKTQIEYTLGVNHSLVENEFKFNGVRQSISTGVYVNFVNKNFHELRTGILYQSKGAKLKSEPLKLDYISIPLLLGISISNSGMFKLMIGPELDFLVNDNMNTFIENRSLKTLDLALFLGFKSYFSHNLYYTVGVSLGKNEILENQKNKNIAISMGFVL